MSQIIQPKELKYCNCAACERELLGDSHRDWYNDLPPHLKRQYPKPVAGRIFSRPYCDVCLQTAEDRVAVQTTK